MFEPGTTVEITLKFEPNGTIKLIKAVVPESPVAAPPVTVPLNVHSPTPEPLKEREVKEADVRLAFVDALKRTGKEQTMAALAATGLARLSDCPAERYPEVESLFLQLVKNDSST